MQIKSGVLTGIATMLCGVAVQAASPPLPAIVAAGLKDVASICSDAGGKALTNDAIKRADLNADGFDDYVLDLGSVNCDGAASIYGDREKSVTIYVGDGKGGAKNVYSDSTYGVRLEGTGPAAKLWLTVSGASCGKPPAKDFASENFCDRAIVWNAKTRTFDYAPVPTIKMIQ